MGCSLAASLVAGIKEFRRSISPDYLFVEPSELVVTAEMRNVIKMGLRDIAFTIGPFITLVDGVNFGMLWEERRPLLLGQITGADLVALTKADSLPLTAQAAEMVALLQAHCPQVLLLSNRTGLGVKEVMTVIA